MYSICILWKTLDGQILIERDQILYVLYICTLYAYYGQILIERNQILYIIYVIDVLYVLYYHVYYMHAMEDLRWPDTDRKRQGSVIKYCR